jgi:hypothetical protein
MPYIRTPAGITPPAPGLVHVEPEFVPAEDVIPGGDSSASAVTDRKGGRDERPLHSPERE